MNAQILRTGGCSPPRASLLVVLFAATFVVQQTQQALVLQFGRVRSVISEPGLYFKVPFIENVVTIEKRVLDLDLPVQTILSADRQNLEVDAFARYRIPDPLRSTSRSTTSRRANQRLSSFVNSSMRNVLASASRDAIVRTERARADEPHPGRREPAGAEPRHRDHRPAAHAGRPAGGEQPGGVPAHADRAPARGGGPARQRPAAGADHPGPRRARSRPSSSPRPTAAPRSCAARATPRRTASSPRPSGGTRTSSPSTAPCRPTRPA